jgi:uncharacterized protein YegL
MAGLVRVPPPDGTALPIIVIADATGSMAQEDKIDAVNAALRGLIAACARRAEEAAIAIAVIAFGDGEPRIARPPLLAADPTWTDLSAKGGAALAPAITLAAQLVDRHAAAFPVGLRPVLILVSDGHFHDDNGPHPERRDTWLGALARLDARLIGRICDRLAIAIGPDADRDKLDLFVKPASLHSDRLRVIDAGSEEAILDFLRFLPISSDTAMPVEFETLFAPPAPAAG